MGKFKNEVSPIHDWLLRQGWEDRTGAQGQPGLTKTYIVDDNFYLVWITINLNKRRIDVYKEYYDCGGCVGEDEITIEEDWLDNLETFIDRVDSKLSGWIDE